MKAHSYCLVGLKMAAADTQENVLYLIIVCKITLIVTNRAMGYAHKVSDIKSIKIRNILDYLDQKGTPGKPSKFIMMCLLRPEIDAKFCSGARNTLTFAESVCSTCT